MIAASGFYVPMEFWLTTGLAALAFFGLLAFGVYKLGRAAWKYLKK